MEVHRTVANDQVEADRGKVSLERGPIVYALEGADNEGKVLNSVLDDGAAIRTQYESDKLDGVVTLKMDGQSLRQGENKKPVVENKPLTAIPYYAWANRGKGEMTVWVPRTVEVSKAEMSEKERADEKK